MSISTQLQLVSVLFIMVRFLTFFFPIKSNWIKTKCPLECVLKASEKQLCLHILLIDLSTLSCQSWTLFLEIKSQNS